MVSTKLELPGDVQEQSFTSALKKPVPKIFKFSEKNIFIGIFICQIAGLEFTTLLKKESLALEFSCDFCAISQSSFMQNNWEWLLFDFQTRFGKLTFMKYSHHRSYSNVIKI